MGYILRIKHFTVISMADEEKMDTIGNGKDNESEPDTSDEVIETSESEDEVKIVDEKFRPKIKPVLDARTRDLMEKKKTRKIPEFKRQEWFRYKRLGDHWRKPRGLHSKMRTNKKYRPPMARIGYRTPSEVRGLHPSGFRDVLVYNASDLEKIDPEKEAARIGKTVGRRKRLGIIEKADSLNIRVLNRRGL